jgi:hypothetical protein
MANREVGRAQRELRRGRQDPDAFFADRGFTVVCHQVQSGWWADLWLTTRLHEEGYQGTHHGFGVGPSEWDSKVSAVERWMYQEEHPDLRRQSGDPLP